MQRNLILKRNHYNRMGGENYIVLSEGQKVGIIELHTGMAPPKRPWYWSISTTRVEPEQRQGYCVSREEAMGEFRKTWDQMEG